MSIVKMKRLHVLGADIDKEKLLQALISAGCVEISEPNEEELEEFKSLIKPKETRNNKWHDVDKKFEKALETMDKYAPHKEPLFEDYIDINENEFLQDEFIRNSEKIADDIIALGNEILQNINKANSISNGMLQLKPWEGLDLNLNFKDTKYSICKFVTFPVHIKEESIIKSLEEAAPMTSLFKVGADKEQSYYVAVIAKEEAEAAYKSLSRNSANYQNFRDDGTAAEQLAKSEKTLEQINNKIEELKSQMEEMRKYSNLMKNAYDRAVSENEKFQVETEVVNVKGVFYLTGWTPAEKVDELVKLFDECNMAYDFTDPKPDDNVPIKLKNNRLTRPLNMVTNMYSLPMYHNIDPNPLIMPFFCVFFGIMYADMGYGIVLLILGIILTKKVKKEGTFKYMAGLLIECGIPTIIFGILFGSIFGDAYNYIPALKVVQKIPIWGMKDPVADPMWFLYGSIILGIIHLLTGMIVHLVIEIREKRPLEGILDVVPWWTLFLGIAFIVMGKGFVLLIVGVVFLVATQGRHKPSIPGKILSGFASLYDITSWLGDVLSYTRIMALMLAGSVIAQVFNMLGSLPGSIIAFILIFVVGQIFNMAINLIGTFVHSARLQYLEFFGKFYEDGGEAFTPLEYSKKYSRVIR